FWSMQLSGAHASGLAMPHWLGPALPQDWPVGHGPQSTTPPHFGSVTGPQLALSSMHVDGVQPLSGNVVMPPSSPPALWPPALVPVWWLPVDGDEPPPPPTLCKLVLLPLAEQLTHAPVIQAPANMTKSPRLKEACFTEHLRERWYHEARAA